MKEGIPRNRIPAKRYHAICSNAWS